MKETLEQLFKFDRQLLGSGYDNALEYLKSLIDIETIEISSGTRCWTWTVPDEWVVKGGWIKFNGEKIVDYQKEPLSVMVYSEPVNKKVTLQELKDHLHWSDDLPDATPYKFKFYDHDWGFCVPKNQVLVRLVEECESCEPELKAFDPEAGKIAYDGETKEEVKDRLEEGEYEVFIDSEFKPGVMKLGVHTIPGESDREILLFAHLDHPYQANDNLSAVVCLLDLAKRIKSKHTIKIIFCPETIGSVAYAYSQDLSKVDFVISVDICGNDNTLLVQKSFNTDDRLNDVLACALQQLQFSHRKAKFRSVIGSDETVFNDPLIGIPGLMISRHPYNEYHTNWDTPEKINYDKITETGDLIQKIIDIYEKDYIPVREFKGQLMRSRYGIQSPHPQINLNWDYLMWSIDGKKYLSEICSDFQMPFEQIYETFTKLEDDKTLSRADAGKAKQQKTSK